ncbi:M20 metallopeptidase family protein [Paenibacillus senegalimassiliensis]|uniref:M20 metallopeptidase family protein n=1 Tax=Paenibacillus senegalimassiliensis TaxID=1737426 RepID=UPI00073F5F71|nr:M20 family metallopeptidase [Paenibacillus senegalimassiliensis]
MSRLLDLAHERADKWIWFRRELHRYPERSLEEEETARKIREQLDHMRISYRSDVGGYGIVVEISGGQPGPTIALRADMDALPIQEQTNLAFASENPGLMHACGHDAHTAILLGVIELLAGERFAGTVRCLFQPAEEVNTGAKSMIAEKVLEGVAEIYGLHNLPTLPADYAATRSGPMMGSVDRIEIILEGKGAHGAIPDQGIDPIVCAAALIQSLQSIVSREISPFSPVVVTIGSVHAGDANNVIPQYVQLAGTVRTFNAGVQQGLSAALERIVRGIAAAHRCEASLKYIHQVPVLVNHERQVQAVEAVIEATLGSSYHRIAEPLLAGEDFSVYLAQVPGCFFWLGSGPEKAADQAFGLHHPQYELNEACIPVGMALLAGIALSRLQPSSGGADDDLRTICEEP